MAANTEYLDLYEQEIQGQYIAPDRNKHIFGVKQHEDQTGVFFGPDYNYRTDGDYHRPDEDTPEQSFVLQSVQRNYTPTESEQTETVVAEVGYDGLQKVEVSIDAIPSTYVGSNVTKKQGSTITPSTQQQIAVPANNYTLDDVIVNAIPNQYIIPTGTKEIEITTNGTLIENIATYSNAEIEVNVPNSYSVEDEGKVVSNGALTSQTSATYTSNNTYNTTTVNSVTVNVPTGSEPILQSLEKNYTPTESSQSEDITPESGYDGLSQVRVNVGAISSTYVGSQISRKSSSDLTQNGATVNVPAGYYQSAASKTVASGTEGTPVATKGTVSNHAISVIPSVTNTAGYIAGGTKTGTTVTVSASQLVSGAKQISSNGTNIDVTNYATVNVSVEGGSGGDSGSIGQVVQDANGYLVISPESSNGEDREDLCEPKDVDFIDYDGRLLYSYTATDFLELSALPPNPTNEGLVAQGWNWTLADAKEYVQQNGTHVIGQNYTTSDGATHAYIHIPDGLINVPFGVNIQTSVKAGTTINWGDGTSTTTNENANTLKLYTHAYDTSGDYEIIISSSSGDFQFGANLLNQYAFSNANYPTVIYRPYIRKVAIGSNCSRLNRGCFNLCVSLESMSIPTTLTSFDSNGNGQIWQDCVSLKALVIPSGTTNLKGYNINSCTNIKYISLPKTLTSCNLIDAAANRMLRKLAYPSVATAPDRLAYGCTSLTHFAAPGTYTTVKSTYLRDCPLVKRVTIPATVTSVQTFALHPCLNMEEIHFLSTTPPSLAGTSNMFTTSDRLSIYVPYSADHSILNAYKTATNWSTFASYIKEEPQ